MTIKSILIARTDKIGDLVLSIPSFYMIRKMYPDVKLGVLVRNYNYGIVKNLPYIDEVIKIDDYEKKALIQKIKSFQADAFVALFSNAFVAKLARKSGARIRVGPYSKLSSFFSYNRGLRQKRSASIKNEAAYNLDLVRSLNPQLYDKHYEINTKIYYEETHEFVANQFLKKHQISGKKLIIHPFMGGSAKNIRVEQYVELINAICQKYPKLSIIITAAKSDEAQAIMMKDQVVHPHVFVFANEGSLLNLAALIDKGDVYIGSSTGPTHIAGSLGKAIIALYPAKASQSPTRWGVFASSKVDYVIPDQDNPKENYQHPFFDTYGEVHKKMFLAYLARKL